MEDEQLENRRRVWTLVVVDALVVALVGLIIGIIARAWWLGLVVGLVVGVAAMAVVIRAGAGMILRRCGARTAPAGEYPRFHNLVEGLCVSYGLDKPDLYVLDDPARNAMALGRDHHHAAIAVTTGLLGDLERIELEAVLAHELARIRRLDIGPATAAAVLWGAPGIRQRVVGHGREVDADSDACGITRYPPGLIAALEKVREHRAAAHTGGRFGAQLWFADPLPSEYGSGQNVRRLATHVPLEYRIALLQER